MTHTYYLVHLFFDHMGEYLPLNKIFASYEDAQTFMADRTEKYLISEHN